MPWSVLIESYFDEKLDIVGDVEKLIRSKEQFTNYRLTPDHAKFFFTKFLPELIIHSKELDKDLVTGHYDRGNDFFEAFLGSAMTYTSGFFKDPTETLEQAQANKMDLVCRKMKLQPGERHLDIGCGWGPLVRFAAKNYGSDSTGVTIAEEQVKYATEAIKREGVEETARVLLKDYRDIEHGTYDKISCLEMAEHVGIKNFQKFMRQISSMLKDDGIFYLQIAGLRRNYDMQDLNWGLFMAKYIFRGADASLPLSYVVDQLEKAGWEIHSVETIGIHYSLTIHRWHQNWMRNHDRIVAKYGERAWRIWNIFLAWSVLIAEEGGSTCFQIVCNKNRRLFDRTMYIGEQGLGEPSLTAGYTAPQSWSNPN
jgi:cyclopropane fatty-acyl-phospholipid synthase-like methyltransferase